MSDQTIIFTAKNINEISSILPIMTHLPAHVELHNPGTGDLLSFPALLEWRAEHPGNQ